MQLRNQVRLQRLDRVAVIPLVVPRMEVWIRGSVVAGPGRASGNDLVALAEHVDRLPLSEIRGGTAPDQRNGRPFVSALSDVSGKLDHLPILRDVEWFSLQEPVKGRILSHRRIHSRQEREGKVPA